MTPPSSSLDDLQDIRLDDNAQAEQQHRSTRPGCLCGPLHEILLIIVAAFVGATFLTLHRGTIVVTDSLKHSLSMDASGTSWITASSSLTAGVFLLPLAHIADRCHTVSRKTLLLGSLALFSIVTGLAALCRDGIVLDVTLGFSGILAAAQLPVMSSMLTSVYSDPSTRRHCAFTFFLAGGNSIAVVFGGVGSGLAASYTTDWRTSFLYIAVLFIIILVVALFAIPNLPKAGSYPEEMVHDPEEQNALLASKPTLTLAPEVDWRSPWIVVMFVYGAMCAFAFRAWELYTDTPMVPRAVWQNFSLLLTLVSTFFLSMSFFSTLFWVSFFMQDVQRLSSLQVGIRLLPQAVTSLLLSPLVGCWMHNIPNQFILVAAAMCQIGASLLLLFLREHSNYFAYLFPSLILSTLSMDWVRNVGAQFIIRVLPLADQIVGASILQIVTRLGIPLGMGITTAIWSSTEYSYTNTFIATIAFAAIALIVSPFARIGRLGIASTASIPSSSGNLGRLPTLFRHSDTSLSLTDSIFKNLNHDGPAHVKGKRFSQLIQPRSSSLPGVRAWKKRSSKRASSSFHLPQIPGSRISGAGVGVPDETMDECRRLSQTPQRTSTAMASRVIWLVCEDCGSSKRIVESVGDPDRYFYDASGVEDGAFAEPKKARPRSSVCQNVEDEGAAVSKRRFSLLKGPTQPGT
ncbi:hypothetical protein VMCG_09694 [Cytospora schulzeri]|uniref:Major facilitator superfamily (MFS) profile domain-containing protein n=1 Tax=Cytospora schulzeri TaxID=448051 RepID=A0A423VK31_9PEZI|nr:hypothetical protein VMCG_09694 [Valsa malicola]